MTNIYKNAFIIHRHKISTNRLININQTPERLKQTAVEKDLQVNIEQQLRSNKKQTDKKKQILSQIKIHNEHLKNITKFDKYKKLNHTSTTEHKTEYKSQTKE